MQQKNIQNLPTLLNWIDFVELGYETSKYEKQLEPFQHVPFFTAEQAVDRNVPRHAIAYLVKKGTLERIYPGAYRFSEYRLSMGEFGTDSSQYSRRSHLPDFCSLLL